ncbi:MAG TPA: amidohydrolase family protein [Candidatus Acidoferrales bacterium]|nr:amidohydrolase family protein [Candidatus Acidoferrales bacterium]
MEPVRPPDPNTRAPELKAPPGACDTHLHLYGPFDRYPLSPRRHYTPAAGSTLADYLKVHQTLGLERAVIVTGSGNGTNNQITADATARMEGKFKGVALLAPEMTDRELVELRDAGFTGFRIKADGRDALSLEQALEIAPRVCGFGWHVEFQPQSLREALGVVPALKKLRMPYLFDHVARTGPREATGGDFRELLRLLRSEEDIWINLYSFYQRSEEGPPRYADMVPIAQAIVEARPERVLWGTNWPHGGVRVPIPNDADLLDFLLVSVPDEKTRKLILSDNPAKLYGWSQS